MKKLIALAAAACLLAGCSDNPQLEVVASPKNVQYPGGIHFIYRGKTTELNFFDEGFDGTLDYTHVIPYGQPERTVTRDSSDFLKYDSMYHVVRNEATTGRAR